MVTMPEALTVDLALTCCTSWISGVQAARKYTTPSSFQRKLESSNSLSFMDFESNLPSAVPAKAGIIGQELRNIENLLSRTYCVPRKFDLPAQPALDRFFYR